MTVWLQRQTQPAATRDASPCVGEWTGPGQPESYEVALWAACHRALETAEALQDDLERLRGEPRRSEARSQSRGRSRAHSRNQSRTCSRGQSGSWVRANSQSRYHNNPQGVCPHSPDKLLPRKKVSFCNSNDVRVAVKEEVGCSMEPSIDDLEAWLEFQAGQLGTPVW